MKIKSLVMTIAKEEGIAELIFEEFMRRSFPNESNKTVIKRWARFFKTGNPTSYMSKESKEIFLELIGKPGESSFGDE